MTQQLRVFAASSSVLSTLDLANDNWRVPAHIPAGKREDAKAELARLEPSFAEPDTDRVRQWLGSLGVLTSGGRMTADDAKSKCAAYAAMLDYPVGCYTKTVLRAVARQLTFFPSFAELCAALDKEKARLWRTRNRLEALIEHQPQQRAAIPPRSAETQAAIDAAVAGLRAPVEADYAEARRKALGAGAPLPPGQEAVELAQ